jgi:hypothetical protein
MKNIKYFLLSFLIIVLFPKYSFAQMILSNLSSEREIVTNPIIGVMPIKTMNWDDNHIISLVHYGSSKYNDGSFFIDGDTSYHIDACGASVFYLTTVGTNTTKRVMISNHTITDFCIVGDTIYMCGQNSAGDNFVAYENVNILFNTNNSLVNIFGLNNVISDYTLTNIDFCISAGQPTLLLLANKDGSLDSYFITYSLVTNTYITYQSPDSRLLDIDHTNDYIAVLGMKGDSIFTLTRHPINNISTYIGKEFTTGRLYTHFWDPKYHLASQKDSNHVVVAASTNSIGGLEFHVINLNNLSILYTQTILDSRDGRSKIMDLEFDEQRNILYCLFCSGFYNKDVIIQMRPYHTQNYHALVSMPQTYNTSSGYNLLKDITLYGDNSQLLTLGRTPTLNIYLFDRIFDFNFLSACDQIEGLYSGIVENSIRRTSFSYSSPILPPFSSTTLQQVQLNKSITGYSVICQ